MSYSNIMMFVRYERPDGNIGIYRGNRMERKGDKLKVFITSRPVEEWEIDLDCIIEIGLEYWDN